MEEFQVYFETDDQDVNKEIAALLSFIMAVGPSAGVIILSSSQKPSGVGAGDVARLFNRYRDNHAVRFALKCGNRVVSEAVLGGDAYAEGFDASSLPSRPAVPGRRLSSTATSDDTADRADLPGRPHRRREDPAPPPASTASASARCPAMAAGEKVAREIRDILADVRSRVRPGETGLQWPAIADRLAERTARALRRHHRRGRLGTAPRACTAA